MVISMLKIRRPLGRLIFNMGIAIPGKTVFLIETAPWSHIDIFDDLVQDCGNSSADALELPQSCNKPSFWCML